MAVTGIFCLNAKCKHYFEDNCTHIWSKDSITVGSDGRCETFEAGVNEGYLQEENHEIQGMG